MILKHKQHKDQQRTDIHDISKFYIGLKIIANIRYIAQPYLLYSALLQSALGFSVLSSHTVFYSSWGGRGGPA